MHIAIAFGKAEFRQSRPRGGGRQSSLHLDLGTRRRSHARPPPGRSVGRGLSSSHHTKGGTSGDSRAGTAARAKARRGELRIGVPVGYSWHREAGLGTMVKRGRG